MRTGATISLQDLRKKISVAAKSDKRKRFWGMYCHVTKKETLYKAYRLAKDNNGAPGVDGVTFDDIEEASLDDFIENLKRELDDSTYLPMRNRRKEIPKDSGKTRTLGIPTIKDRVVQGALKLILEPIFEADFADSSYGYRPGRSQHDAVTRVAKAPMRQLTTVIDVDLSSYFDNIKHHILLKKVARRIKDPKIMRLLKLIIKANGKQGVPQGGVISPLLSNIYLNRIDQMFKTAIKDTEYNGYQQIEYCRFADDMVILVNGHENLRWLVKKAVRRLKEELGKLQVKINKKKSQIIKLKKGDTFNFLGFIYRLTKRGRENKMVLIKARKKKINKLREKVRNLLRSKRDKSLWEVIPELNDILRGWTNYYRIGHCGKIFGSIKQWVEEKVRRFVRKAQGRKGFGWNEWSSQMVYETWGLYNDYQIRYYQPKANST